MTNLQKAINFAQKSIYHSAEHIGRWKGFEVFKPTFNDDTFRAIGLPRKILIKNNDIRYSLPDETFDMLDFFNEE